MITGRRATDWLAGPSSSQSEDSDRRGNDRRNTDRRAPRRRFDPMFAATLVNQIAPAEADVLRVYTEPPAPVRRGIMVNCRA